MAWDVPLGISEVNHNTPVEGNLQSLFKVKFMQGTKCDQELFSLEMSTLIYDMCQKCAEPFVSDGKPRISLIIPSF